MTIAADYALESVAPRWRFRRPRFGLALSIGWLALVVFVAVFVQWLPIEGYVERVGGPNVNPGLRSEFLGTDSVGRSMLSRLAHGARVSLVIGLCATGLGMSVGLLLGMSSVYIKGLYGYAVDTMTNSLLAIPNLVLMLALVLALGADVSTLIIGLSIVTIPAFTRVARSSTLDQLGRGYVFAARVMGASGGRMLFREILPSTAPHVISYAVLVLPATIITEGSLSFLGFGVQPPSPSWGGMIALGRVDLVNHPWQAIVPCLILFFTVFALNRVGDELRLLVS